MDRHDLAEWQPRHIADALVRHQKLWPTKRRGDYDHTPERDRFWPLARAVAESFEAGRYTVVMEPATPVPASTGRAEGSEGWYQNLPKKSESPGHR